MTELGSLVPGVVIGLLAIGGGVLIIRHRAKLMQSIGHNLRHAAGKRAATFVVRRASPFWVGVAGGWACVLGIGAIVMSLGSFIARLP